MSVGASPAEVASTLPGDDLLPRAHYRCTRAITIDAPTEAVWPWLVQAGCLRGGYYSNDLLDNLGHPSAREIVAELQHLEVGQWVPMSPTPSDATAFKVDGFEVNRWLRWRKPDSTWVWTLTELGDGKTRLLTNRRTVFAQDLTGSRQSMRPVLGACPAAPPHGFQRSRRRLDCTI